MRPVSKTQLSVLSIVLLLFVSMLSPICTTSALEPPRIIPHSGSIKKPPPELFKLLKSYFSDRLESKFELVSADEKAGTIVARQTGIDSARWRQWAACQTDPMHMIYQLDDAMVTLTIKLDPGARKTTFMTVSADFQGRYGLAQDQTTIACKSTGVLENNLLAFAGAPMTGARDATTSTAPAP